jgi:N,N'-diacetyllegionaminate synthase
MKIDNFDLDKKVFVIAEVGNNHEGDFSVALELVARAVETGADAVKFQTFIPEHYVSANDTARLERLRKFQLSQDQFAQLAQMARKLGLVFFSTPFDLASARFLNTVQPLFKIASGDNNFYPLIETVASFRKPMIVSTGLADMVALTEVRRRIRGVWGSADPGLSFLHCVASYPVPSEQANLGAIPALARQFPDVTIGYSDHTLGIEAAVLAVAAGARLVEKHFTLAKDYSDFRDHQLSADPADMKALVIRIREVSAMMGTGEKNPQECEESLRSAVRRSIAAGRDLAAGAVVSPDDLTWVRPADGIAPGHEAEVIGKKLNRALKMGEAFMPADLGDA